MTSPRAASRRRRRPAWRHWLLPVGLLVAFFLWLALPGIHGTAAHQPDVHAVPSDVSAHKVKTVDLPQAGGASTGTLTNGTSYTVILPSPAQASRC